ncbi:hypothetical protein OG500_20230 [Kitasatospora sp. NBC_01250]|uniref:hypothetical protein n=1 Tax=unclassified Kitasatospora TaxID=2633591 RepID=UPI002E0D5334|nr:MULTISPECIES: hypothetical protein [unclassified Kitasatospora]WSJ68390.1 hypothetical protein OG294_21020 [Kitasatospora sp. NBC_01302]
MAASTRIRKTVSAGEMAEVRAEYLAAQGDRVARGTPELVNTAWCGCPKHQCTKDDIIVTSPTERPPGPMPPDGDTTDPDRDE